MKPMTHELHSKIINYIKSGIDISDLIADVDIKNMDLSDAIISKFNVNGQDISGCKFTRAKIAHSSMIRTIARNVNFDYADLSSSNCRCIDAVGATFLRANCMNTDFCGADLRRCNFCDMTITFSARYLYKTKVSSNVLMLLDNVWTIMNDGTTSQFSSPR